MAASKSSEALDALLDEDCPEARAIIDAYHRTVLWRYRTGRGKPDADGVAEIERLSGKRVPANGWRDQKSTARNQPKRPKSAA